MTIRLIVADDHPLILNGLSNLFQLEEDFDVLACCADGQGALQAVRMYRPDVVVLDVTMPLMSGLQVARKIVEENLPSRLVLLTATLDEEDMLEAAQLGVQGIVLKEMAPQLLVQCIRRVHSGEQWIERRSAKQALEKILQRERNIRKIGGILTSREIELVRMIAQGLRNKEIADQLCISEGTVKVHLHNIYDKLKVDGRMALLRYAQEKGLA